MASSTHTPSTNPSASCTAPNGRRSATLRRPPISVYREALLLLALSHCSGAPDTSADAGQLIERSPAPALPRGEVLSVPENEPSRQPILNAFPTSPRAAFCRAYEFEQSSPPPPDDELVTVEQSVPSVFYLMLDRSGSMNEAERAPTRNALFSAGQPASSTPWSQAVTALTSFFEDPQSAGLQLALNYFPGPGECNGDGYATPDVEVGVLPEHSPALVESLLTQFPDGFTPMEGALRGATRFCTDYRATHPDEACVAILLTDGAPTRCSARTAAELAAIAQEARQQGVLSFAAGMAGADFDVLEAIAQAGGGDCNPAQLQAACDLSASPAAFLEALTRIRDTVRTQSRLVEAPQPNPPPPLCTWTLADTGTPSSNGFRLTRATNEQPPVPVARLASVDSCQAGREGWALEVDSQDSNSAVAHLCPYSCQLLREASTSTVEIAVPCPDSVAPR